MFTRREILKSFLGLPIAMAACKRPFEISSIEGSIVGASNNIGHILREKRNFEVPAENWSETKIAIIGGGIAGLSAAWKLKREGRNDFILFELEQKIGGTSTSGTSDLVGYPWGAHYLPVPFKENTELVELLDEMNLIESRAENGDLIVPEQYLTRDPEERVFYKGRWYEGLYLNAGATEKDLSQLKAFQKELDNWVNWRDADGKRAFSVPVSQCSEDAEVTALDKISFADWLKQKGFDSERLIWYCDYACRDDYGLRLAQTSAWAGLFYFCSRVRTAGEESQPFITCPEGNGQFVNHFVSKTKDHLNRSKIVVELIPKERGVDIIYLDTKTNQMSGIHAERAIFSAPLFTANYLIRGFRETPGFDANQFQHNSWFVANLFLKDRPKNTYSRDFPLSWDNVLYESRSLGYVVATHQKGIDYGKTILTYYYPMAEENLRTGMQKLLALDWKELADICLSDLAQAHPDIREITEKIDIMRWGHAMISPRQGFVWSGEREKAQKPYRNIHFAHSDLSGIAIFEEAFHHGLRAAGEVLEKQ
ncbi:MAG: FAD-dependent oxidoreductase [Acidobacteria bacterium]|nr:FAD-dependent oxidoreductase [Acidobacteriota bacterium]